MKIRHSCVSAVVVDLSLTYPFLPSTLLLLKLVDHFSAPPPPPLNYPINLHFLIYPYCPNP